MKEIFETIIDVLIAVTIMFLAVAIYFGLRTETIFHAADTDISSEFISNVKKNGYLSVNDYEDFIEKVSLTGILFDVGFEHTFKQYEPEYRFRTIEEIIAAQKAAYTGTNNYVYKAVSTAVPSVYDPPNTGKLNTQTNESILAAAVNTPALASHIHTTDCYAGHRHVDGDRTFLHIHKHTSDCKEYVAFFANFGTCPNDGTVFQRYFSSSMWDTATNSSKLISSAYLTCPVCGGTATVNSYSKTSYRYSCGYDRDIDNDGYFDKTDSINTYEYIKSSPPIEGISRYDYSKYQYITYPLAKTYTSGCYSYHVHGVLPELVTDQGPRYWTSASGVVSDLKQYGWQSFCEIPNRFEVRYHSPNGTLGADFRPAIENGQLVFKCTGVVGMSIYAWYPDISFDTLYNIMSYSSQWITFISSNGYVTQSEARGYVENGSNAFNVTDSFNTCNVPSNAWYLSCNKTQEDVADCNQNIVTITPTNPIQTIYVGEQLVTTVKVTYLDGSTKILLANSSFSTASPVKNQNVGLSYTYTYRGASVTKTCNLMVSVILRSKTCINGHTYNMNLDGSDPGCPYCKVWIKSLRVTNPSTSTMTITIGTTLQENGVTVLATYLDSHTESLTTGFIDNLDTKYLGIQTVTIGYKGATTTLVVQTQCAKMTCSICGYVYDLYPDGTNPGCPRCISKTPVFTGNVKEYEKTVYTKEILESLYEDGKYKLNTGDTFTIKMKNRSSDLARNILRKIFPSLSNQWFMFRKSEYIGEK